MDCHCKDHLPGDRHSHEDCDCNAQEHPTYSFVVTKVMEQDPGTGTVFISKAFMDTLGLKEGDPVRIKGLRECSAQAKSHPNPWVDTRMVSMDRDTMNKTGAGLFSQVKIRKAKCGDARTLTLEAPDGAVLSRMQIRSLLDKVKGAVLHTRDYLRVVTAAGEEFIFRIRGCDPDDVCKIGPGTQVLIVDAAGEEYSSKRDVTFKDVGGLGEAVRKVKEIVQLPLKHPEVFFRLGIDPPRGVLLHGPSGTGKTLIARAVAGETGCRFKSISGTEVMDKYYGESEAKLRAAFDEAQANAPAILFIDEIDALAPKRDTVEGEVEKRITAQLLALMDGMEDRGAVMVLAATNLPNALDPALRRPGRFDREVFIGPPDRVGRREILEIHTRDMPLENVDLAELAERTHGFVGADIKALCQEAGFKALRRVLPGLEDTEQRLSEDFLDAVSICGEDFAEAVKEMRPSAGRGFESDVSRAGWNRIAGYEKAVEFLKDTVLWPMRNADALTGLGVGAITGMLITGPSGVGKTLFAETIAKESAANVIVIRGPELISKYMGESERNIRDLFRRARELAPTVLLLDGVDSMTDTGWSDSKVIDRIVDQIVMEMNALDDSKPVFVVATASRADRLPPALRASGKLGRELKLDIPAVEDRVGLLKMYLGKPSVRLDADLEEIAKMCDGFTPGDIEEAARRTLLHCAKKAIERLGSAPDHLNIGFEEIASAMDYGKFGFPAAR